MVDPREFRWRIQRQLVTAVKRRLDRQKVHYIAKELAQGIEELQIKMPKTKQIYYGYPLASGVKMLWIVDNAPCYMRTSQVINEYHKQLKESEYA